MWATRLSPWPLLIVLPAAGEAGPHTEDLLASVFSTGVNISVAGLVSLYEGHAQRVDLTCPLVGRQIPLAVVFERCGVPIMSPNR